MRFGIGFWGEGGGGGEQIMRVGRNPWDSFPTFYNKSHFP